VTKPAPQIRLATPADAVAISALVTVLAREFVLPGQLPATRPQLLAWLSADAIAGRIALGQRHHVAELDGVIVGVVGTRDERHLHLLFVDTRHQRRGIARALWRVARDACMEAAGPGRITVNASGFAVPAYVRLGFVQLGPPETRDGILTTPMAFDLAPARPPE
jgi:GNAT superfamily N-acetyltransferase